MAMGKVTSNLRLDQFCEQDARHGGVLELLSPRQGWVAFDRRAEGR